MRMSIVCFSTAVVTVVLQKMGVSTYPDAVPVVAAVFGVGGAICWTIERRG
jgi:ATP-dependent Clp protease adapter protein ClpS